MREPSAQQLYDTTLRFLNKQGCRSTRGIHRVPAYIGDRKRCAIGMYIPKPFYVKWGMEGRGVADLIYYDRLGFRHAGLMERRQWFVTHENLLRSLMLAHDPSQAAQDRDGRYLSPDPIVNRLRAVARVHGLNDSVLDQLSWPEFWI